MRAIGLFQFSRYTFRGVLICICLHCGLLTGCTYWELKRNITHLERMAFIGGKISWDDCNFPLVAILTAGTSGKIVDSYTLVKPGSFIFVVPAGIYRLAAFVDMNHNLTYQPGLDPAAFYDKTIDVRTTAARAIDDIQFHVAKDVRVRFDLASLQKFPGKREPGGLPGIHLGEITKINDPRFSRQNGEIGLWRPADFLFDVGAGIYFLEAYDPHKMPVIFFHGVAGNPAEWKFLIEQLDSKQFQTWLVYYPSGLRIDTTALFIARSLGMLNARYGVQRYAMVAHSIGGLVVRATINRMIIAGEGANLATLVTLSTPWGGHAAAESGVKHAPVAIPLWNDIIPECSFLTDLFRNPLPAQCPYYLLFSYNGVSRLLNEPNDGAVAISSELSQDAQQTATKILGFKENHESILKSPEVSRVLNAILAEAYCADGKERR